MTGHYGVKPLKIIQFFEELCTQLNIDWSDITENDLFSETELARWLSTAYREAVARHPWPFTEGREEISSVSGQEKYDYPTNIKTGSLRYLTVNDKRYKKLLFEDYLIHLEDYTSCEEKLFSERNRIIYVNYNATDFGNSIVCYGQVEVTGSVTSATTSTVFTEAEPEADEAILKLAHSKALASDKMKNPTRARIEKAEAFQILDEVWQRIVEKRHTYRTKERPLFKRVDVLSGRYEDELYKRDQF